jgi:hypothetical protein
VKRAWPQQHSPDERLASLAAWSGLESLDLRGMHVTDAVVAQLQELTALTQVGARQRWLVVVGMCACVQQHGANR